MPAITSARTRSDSSRARVVAMIASSSRSGLPRSDGLLVSSSRMITMSGVTTAARCWSDSAVGERFSCVFGGEMGWRGGEYVRGGDKFGCDGCGDWNVAVLQGPAATAARWFAMTDGVVPGVMRGGRVYEAEVPNP